LSSNDNQQSCPSFLAFYSEKQITSKFEISHNFSSESLESIKSALDGLSEALENSSMEIPPPPNQQKCTAAATPSGGLQQQQQQIGNGGCAGGIAFPPLLDRSHQRKQDAVETEALRWQVGNKLGNGKIVYINPLGYRPFKFFKEGLTCK
jgi:hypothetical protein